MVAGFKIEYSSIQGKNRGILTYVFSPNSNCEDMINVHNTLPTFYDYNSTTQFILVVYGLMVLCPTLHFSFSYMNCA